MDAIIVTGGTAKEIADLVSQLQGQQSNLEFVLIREPYQTHYALVNLGSGREGSFEAK